MKYIEPHLLALHHASLASCELLDILPATDIVEELKTILNIQFDIIDTMICNSHYGSMNLVDFIDHCKQINFELEKIKRD